MTLDKIQWFSLNNLLHPLIFPNQSEVGSSPAQFFQDFFGRYSKAPLQEISYSSFSFQETTWPFVMKAVAIEDIPSSFSQIETFIARDKESNTYAMLSNRSGLTFMFRWNSKYDTEILHDHEKELYKSFVPVTAAPRKTTAIPVTLSL